MESLALFIDVMLHLDVHLTQWVSFLGPWMYVLLFLVIFCETGLVVTPFLPGDSLLFAVGALAAMPSSGLHVHYMALILIVAGILGDAVNYSIGKNLGPRFFAFGGGRFLNAEHLKKTQQYYEKHGGKTIILARFMPIIRTFAPFVAGVGRMSYSKFAVFNVTGAVLWVTAFLYAGFYFGNIPSVKSNFHILVVAIIFISFAPVGWEIARAWFAKGSSPQHPEELPNQPEPHPKQH